MLWLVFLMLNGCSEKYYGKKRQCTILKFQNFLKFMLWNMHYGFRQISTFSFNKILRAHEKTSGGGSTIALNMSVKLENIFNEVSPKSF